MPHSWVGATRIRAIKEASLHFNGFYADNVHQALTVHYEDMSLAVIAGLKGVLSKSRNAPGWTGRFPWW